MGLAESMKYVIRLTTVFIISFIVLISAAEHVKPQVVVTTDGELDGQSSMVRFLRYASDYDIEGIVQVLLDSDPCPLRILAWGGVANTLW